MLHHTPSARVTQRKTKSQTKKENRDRIRSVKRAIESELQKRDSDMLLQNRLSFKKYNAIRLSEAYETRHEAVKRTQLNPHTSKMHGRRSDLPFDENALLIEAGTWGENEQINWTKLAERYGVQGGNRGQVIKEYLANKGVPVANKKREIVRRAKLRLPGGEISYPTHKTVAAQKSTINQKIENKEILIGELIVPTQFMRFVVDKTTKMITKSMFTLHGRKISMLDIRTKMLREQEQAGIVRVCEDPETLSEADLHHALVNRNIEFDHGASLEEKRQLLSHYSNRRYLKVWHDHGKIAGHGHFLVIISGIYDRAFYYTQEELKEMNLKIDAVNLVEKPEIHIIAKSGSADADQMAYSESRVECLLEINGTITSQSGRPISDTLRFFHGDHPAQQFEAGNNRGGNYPCVTCSTHRDRFDDLCHVYRQPVIALTDRHVFTMKGEAWQKGGIRPMDGLTKLELQKELQTRVRNGSISQPQTAPSLAQMKKKELQQELTQARKGICNFPALVAHNPRKSMNDLNIDEYEVASPEPLHDFKGHMQNLISEIRKVTTHPIK